MFVLYLSLEHYFLTIQYSWLMSKFQIEVILEVIYHYSQNNTDRGPKRPEEGKYQIFNYMYICDSVFEG